MGGVAGLAAGAALSAGFPRSARAANLTPQMRDVWLRYLESVDSRVAGELANPKRFLIQDFLPAEEKARIERTMAQGGAAVRNISVPKQFEVPDGEIHHWWGAILVPGTTLRELTPFLQDYGNHAGKFADVERSRMLSREGNTFRFFFRLKRTKAFVTACYNTVQECTYTTHAPGRVSSRSIANRIAELQDPGTPQEKELPPGNDRGYLWGLASWWRFQEVGRGVTLNCESASLSRDIPTVVKFIPGISDYIRSTPRESLESVLTTIRKHAGKA